MSLSRIERIKDFASTLKLVSAGCLLGIFITVPMQGEIYRHFPSFSPVAFMLALMLTAIGLTGLSWRLKGMLDQ